MTHQELIQAAKARYNRSAKTVHDWALYVRTVESVREAMEHRPAWATW
jgi:hypothetical protein